MDSTDDALVTDAKATGPIEIVVAPTPTLDATYPSILQSFGIMFIWIFCAIGCAPILPLIGHFDEEIAMFLYYLAAMGLSFLIVHLIRNRKVGNSTYEFRIASWKLILPLVLTSSALLLGVIGPLTSLIPMPEAASQSFQKVLGQTGAATFLLFVIAAPVLEELIFRGIMLDGLLKRYRPLTAILVSSVIFGLAHLNPWQFVTGLVLGCFIGWVYYRTRSLGPCILIHMAANSTGYVVRMVYSSISPDHAETAAQGDWGSYLVFSAICLMIIFVSVLYLRSEFDRMAMAEIVEFEVPVVQSIGE